MSIKIKQGKPKELFPEVSSIVSSCFNGVWSANDLKQLIDFPHENKLFIVAYKDGQAIGYAFFAVDYMEGIDTKVATIQEIGVLPEHRESELVEMFLDYAIQFSKANHAELLEQVVSTVDQWLIPTLIKKKMTPSEIKADREISSTNEAKLILTNLKKNSKLKVLINQLFFEQNDSLESHIVENEGDLDNLPRKDPIAFGSIISVAKTEELDQILEELYNIGVDWDEIGITFDYLF